MPSIHRRDLASAHAMKIKCVTNNFQNFRNTHLRLAVCLQNVTTSSLKVQTESKSKVIIICLSQFRNQILILA